MGSFPFAARSEYLPGRLGGKWHANPGPLDPQRADLFRLRAAAGRLLAYDRRALGQGFEAHSARKALAAANGKPLPVVPVPSERPRLKDVTAPLRGMIGDTIGEMTKLGAALTRLGGDLTVLAHARKAKRKRRPAPAQQSVLQGDFVPPTGHPSARGLGLFIHILDSARHLSGKEVGGETVPAADAGLNCCLRIARLNLRQCLAAARFGDEEIFCAGRHGFAELGRCRGKCVDAVYPP